MLVLWVWRVDMCASAVGVEGRYVVLWVWRVDMCASAVGVEGRYVLVL